jgi:uncharacterized Rmd1/YagE family protein
MQGKLFLIRQLIILRSELLDTPDFYWGREDLETLHYETFNDLNIPKRTRVMEKKLKECCEMVALLSEQVMPETHLVVIFISTMFFHLLVGQYPLPSIYLGEHCDHFRITRIRSTRIFRIGHPESFICHNIVL